MTYFGIVRAGAIVVPILTEFTPTQISNIIEHAEARIVFVSDKLRAKLEALPGDILVRDIRQSYAPSASATTLPDVAADDLAMIVYTSGTTGLSKGVMLTHRNILSNATACKSIITLRRTDRLLSILPLAHTYEFTIGLVIPLLSGSHIHYLDRPPSTTVLIPALQTVRPTIMLSVPLVIEKIYRSSIKPTLDGMKLYKHTLFRPLILLFAGMKLKKTFGGHLRFFGVGGAPLASDVEEFLKKRVSPTPSAMGSPRVLLFWQAVVRAPHFCGLQGLCSRESSSGSQILVPRPAKARSKPGAPTFLKATGATRRTRAKRSPKMGGSAPATWAISTTKADSLSADG